MNSFEFVKGNIDMPYSSGYRNVVLSGNRNNSTAEINRMWITILQHYSTTNDQIWAMMVATLAELLNLPSWEEGLPERTKTADNE